jgi:hypothetical protein
MISASDIGGTLSHAQCAKSNAGNSCFVSCSVTIEAPGRRQVHGEPGLLIAAS